MCFSFSRFFRAMAVRASACKRFCTFCSRKPPALRANVLGCQLSVIWARAGSECRPGRDSLRFIQIVLVVAGIRCEATSGLSRTGGNVQNARCNRADEMYVVADEDERPVILLERADEGVDRADVQMCGRLVHEHEVGGIE